MRGNIAQLMQQAQQMQENVQKAQEQVAALQAIGSAVRCASILRHWPIRKWRKT